ncbi:MAG: orotate phosphoribosyltransferase, partial [Ilumatobacteraceae bacterium]|nr:orotate phosphoribosyltransferase [Ilumatobacteraceae bacterium]
RLPRMVEPTVHKIDRADLADRINASARLTGTFTLRSGQIATEYFDKYRFEAMPDLLAAIAAGLAPLLPPDTEVLAGLELGGVPIATALSLRTGLPAAFVRKQAKPYGTAQLAEGATVAGKRVTVIEDVITTGGQVIISTNDLRALGAEVRHVVCVIDRSPDAGAPLTAAGLTMVSLLTKSDLDAAEARRP